MRFIWNLFGLIGLVVVGICVGGTAYVMRTGVLSNYDPGALKLYYNVAKKVVETGSLVEATVWRSKVADGLTFEDVDQSIVAIANENNIKAVGELPLYKQIEVMTGKKYRKIKIYMFCNPLTAAKMIDHNDAYSAYLPCRISLIEDKSGQLWIYTLDMDPMIYGGAPLPADLKTEALSVKKIMQDILTRAAEGDF